MIAISLGESLIAQTLKVEIHPQPLNSIHQLKSLDPDLPISPIYSQFLSHNQKPDLSFFLSGIDIHQHKAMKISPTT